MKFLQALWFGAEKENTNRLEYAVREAMPEVMLDVGCDVGTRSVRMSKCARAKMVVGAEIVESRAKSARNNGVAVVICDINTGFPFQSGSIQLVISNQVIEHVLDVDVFLSESCRVLAKNGRIVFSTENLSSWHNICATILGWQPFSLTNVSVRRLGIGNPLAMLRGSILEWRSWMHVRVFSFRGLLELCEEYGLENIKAHGAGYFPFPAWVGRYDPRHAVFLIIEAEKM